MPCVPSRTARCGFARDCGGQEGGAGFAHLRGLPYGRVDIRTTKYPGQLVIEIREKDPSVSGPVA